MPKSSLASRMLYLFSKTYGSYYIKPIEPVRENISLHPFKKLYSTYNIELNKVDNGNFWLCEKKSTQKDDPIVFYFYGSGLIKGPRKAHWKLVEQLLQRCVPKIVLIEAPLYPSHTITSVLDWCLSATTKLINDSLGVNSPLMILGEGSGAWLAYHLLQNHTHQQLPVNELILLCPWLIVP